MSSTSKKSQLKSISLATPVAFAAMISLVACGKHITSYKPKAGDAKSTVAAGAVGANISITNPSRQVTGNPDYVTASFTIVDGNNPVPLQITWKIGSTNQHSQSINGGTYTVATKCANDDCTQFAALFTIQSPNSPGTVVRIADFYQDYGASAGGTMIVVEMPNCGYTNVDDALDGLQTMASPDATDWS